MAVIKKEQKKEVPAISTASLPDVIFMLIFFFMVTTNMREQEMLVKVVPPDASESVKLEKKALASFIYYGPPIPSLVASYGNRPRIQLNDSFHTPVEIGQFIAAERDKLSERDRSGMTVVLKAHNTVRMGDITEIKQELRKANALKIMYASYKAEAVSR